MKYTLLATIILIAAHIFAPESATARADDQFQFYILKQDANAEAFFQQSLRDFKMIKRVQPFEARLNATEKVEYITKPAGAVVTLHDPVTGEPLESCESPCFLSVDPMRNYLIYAYKFGHRGQFRQYYPDMSLDNRTIYMGSNYLELHRKKQACYRDWQRSDKIDAEAQACFRIPPIMPSEAERSGHCKVTFDVDAKGQPFNMRTTFCTNYIFEAPSLHAISWWHFEPRTERGQALIQENVETKMSRVSNTRYAL